MGLLLPFVPCEWHVRPVLQGIGGGGVIWKSSRGGSDTGYNGIHGCVRRCAFLIRWLVGWWFVGGPIRVTKGALTGVIRARSPAGIAVPVWLRAAEDRSVEKENSQLSI